MIKEISQLSSVAKKTLLSALLVGSASLASAKTLNNQTNPIQPNQTEVVSKEGAQAVKANAISPQITQEVPSTQNRKLDNTLRKFIESEEDREYIEDFIKNAYKEYGLFLGSVIIQHEIDMQQLYALMTGNTKVQIKNNINPEYAKKIESIGPKFFKSIIPHEDFMTKWMNDTYSPVLYRELTAFDHKPTAEEIDKKLSYILNNYGNLTRDEVIDYVVYTDNFNRHRLHEEKNNQAKADLLAYQMFMFDRLIIAKQIQKSPVFFDHPYIGEEMPFIDYIDKWMESVEPKGKY